MQQAEWQLREEDFKRQNDRLYREIVNDFRSRADDSAKKRGNEDKEVKRLRKEADKMEENINYKEPDADKLLKDKKNISGLNIVGQQLETNLLEIAKEHKINELQTAQKKEEYWLKRLQGAKQNLEKKYSPLINKYQEMAQMAQSEADRENEQRIIEYIQRLYQAENELIDKLLEIIGKNQQAREKGHVSTDEISNLQVEAKAAMDKYDEYKDKLDAMIKAYKKQKKEAQEKIDKTEDKKEDKKEEKQSKKTLDISGLQDSANSQISSGALKKFNNLQEERSSLRMG